MSDAKCEKCPWRVRYDHNPRSILGRLWRWHINWCPGWKSYMASLSDSEKNSLITLYHLPYEKWKSKSA
jgi:hypothetical protein